DAAFAARIESPKMESRGSRRAIPAFRFAPYGLRSNPPSKFTIHDSRFPSRTSPVSRLPSPVSRLSFSQLVLKLQAPPFRPRTVTLPAKLLRANTLTDEARFGFRQASQHFEKDRAPNLAGDHCRTD